MTSPDGDKDRDNLLVSLVEEGQEMVLNLRQLQLKPSPCYRDSVVEPVNLYHKVCQRAVSIHLACKNNLSLRNSFLIPSGGTWET